MTMLCIPYNLLTFGSLVVVVVVWLTVFKSVVYLGKISGKTPSENKTKSAVAALTFSTGGVT